MTLKFCFIEVEHDTKMAARVEKLEQYLLILTEKLSKQESTNNELLAAIATQQQQRLQEKAALANTIGSLQGTILQLNGKVDKIPDELNKENKRRQRQNLVSAINRVNSKLDLFQGKLGSHHLENASELRVRDTESTSKILEKLLQGEAQKALSLATDVPSKALSTPSGAGPVASASSSPVQQPPPQPSPQIDVSALSTPTGQGPSGSAVQGAAAVAPAAPAPAAPAPAPVAAPAPAPAVYNLPPAPAAGQLVPLEAPGIISPKDPTASADELAVPGNISPFEVLISQQMHPKTKLEKPDPSDSLSPYDFLTTSQLDEGGENRNENFNANGDEEDLLEDSQQQQQQLRHSHSRDKESQTTDQDIRESRVTAHANTASMNRQKNKLRTKIRNKLPNGSLYLDNLRDLEEESPRQVGLPDQKQLKSMHAKDANTVTRSSRRRNRDSQLKGVILQTQKRSMKNTNA